MSEDQKRPGDVAWWLVRLLVVANALVASKSAISQQTLRILNDFARAGNVSPRGGGTAKASNLTDILSNPSGQAMLNFSPNKLFATRSQGLELT